MTPEEFEKAMHDCFEVDHRNSYGGVDMERAHETADEIMCDLLKSLGFEKGVEIFIRQDRWYA